MSVKIKYKDNQIANITTTSNKTIKTSGKYCEGDIIVENTMDQPSLTTKTITVNGTYTAMSDSVDGYSSVTVNV